MGKQNRQRAEWAGQAVRAFDTATASDGHTRMIHGHNREDYRDLIGDLIGDLGHLCDMHGLDFAAIIKDSVKMYREEKKLDE